MTDVFEVSDIYNAIELATKFSKSGKYTWFRGQKEPWPPHSTLMRRQSLGGKEVVDEINALYTKFLNFIKLNPDLETYLSEDYPHGFFAIAQHYGIPTHYIDFTTDPAVAAFFATDGAPPDNNEHGCIYCLNPDELMDVWDSIKKARARPQCNVELIDIDVSNLWRLQSQKGKFVFADWNWEIDFPMDKIVFNHGPRPSYPTREKIYPEEKSTLEIALDEFFESIRIAEGNEWFVKFHSDHQKKDPSVPDILHMKNPFIDGVIPSFFKTENVPPIPETWSSAVAMGWSNPTPQDYNEIDMRSEIIKSDANDATNFARDVRFAVERIVSDRKNLREHFVKWEIDAAIDTDSRPLLGRLFKEAWNGMRVLPYSNEQIATSLAKIAELVWDLGQSDHNKFIRDNLHALGENSITVEFGKSRSFGVSSNAIVSETRLSSAIRSDLQTYYSADYTGRTKEPKFILQTMIDPRRIFEFNEIVDLFVEHLIPIQLVGRMAVTFFNPFEIEFFGLK